MKKITLIITGFLLLAFMTVRLPAQTAQVSQVADLNQQSTSVVNNNLQILQSGLNGTLALFSQYFTNGYLNTNAGGTGTDSSNWTSGDIVYMSSTGTWGHKLLNNNIVVFTSSGTFTVPSGVSIVYISIIGGGGNGGEGSLAAGGGGGGSGQAFIHIPYLVTAGNSYTVTIGMGGSPGGNSVFDLFTALGGTNGDNGNTGGAGGAAIPVFGSTGGGISNSGQSRSGGTGGKGAGSPFGNGSDVGSDGISGSGAGGGGTSAGASSGTIGGSGICIIQY